MLSPPHNAIINMRLGRADSEDYHELVTAVVISFRTAERVDRHRHLLPDIQLSLNALNAIYTRQAQRTIPDAPYSGTPAEVDAIENCIAIYQGIIAATPRKSIARAINQFMRDLG